ncbi:hypothetical protein Mal64_22560 [Pseudobythopirellula maris]|uniref:Uncharacterized protein n=1 Tax=Pseudobythopirellula maris TaxID=2527991 RepID=A0A5C5ZNL1_9BACT|nr:hypothetical protein [Pseudobythopirellula maris]TWT88768.1 hypothetical protein Mal64_22560 [Pseudobythopirellula maris]
MTLPPINNDPAFGYYPWWPKTPPGESSDEWVHPDDRERAKGVIPGPRVWRRDGQEGPYVILHYGDERLRVRRTLWCEVEPEGWEIGDEVSVRPLGMKNDPVIGFIRERLWDETEGAMRYELTVADGTLYEKQFASYELKRLEPLVEREDFELEPPEDDEGVDDLIDGPPAPKGPWN